MEDRATPKTFGSTSWVVTLAALAALLLGVSLLHGALSESGRQAVAFIFGNWGVLVTVIGLAIAIWQLQQSKSATEAAAAAVQRLRSDVGMLDIIAELGTCKQEIGNAIDKLNDGSWKNACAHLQPVRSTLNRIIAVPNKYPEVDPEAFKNHISYLIASETALEPIINDPFDSTEMRSNLRQIADSLDQLETVLREKFGDH